MAKKINPKKVMSDTVFTKSILFNGKKLGGVQAVSLEFDIEKQLTKIHLTMHAKKDSVKIKDNVIFFDGVYFNE